MPTYQDQIELDGPDSRDRTYNLYGDFTDTVYAVLECTPVLLMWLWTVNIHASDDHWILLKRCICALPTVPGDGVLCCQLL